MKNRFPRYTLVNTLMVSCLLFSCSRKMTPAAATAEFTSTARALMKDPQIVSKMIMDTTFEVYPGVREIDLHYLNAASEPMHVYIMKVTLKEGHTGLEAATPYNKPAYARQKLTGIAKWEDTLHHRVVGGVNADFFRLSDGRPRGIEYKDGITVKRAQDKGRFFFGVLENGRPVMGDSLLYIKDSAYLREALGGYPLLVEKGKIVPQKDNAFNHTRHPRTAVGIVDRNSVIFVVIDGRQKTYSNGMPLDELARFMKALNAKYAMNLDGGGSSTFISLDAAGQTLKVRNRPSDGDQRAVANGWLVVSYK